MAKHVFNNHEIPHQWAYSRDNNATDNWGRNSSDSLSFRNGVLMSYNTEMGVVDSGFMFWNGTSYSNTTSKQCVGVWSATSHMKRVNVTSRGEMGFRFHEMTADRFVSEAKQDVEQGIKSASKRRKQELAESDIAHARRSIENVREIMQIPKHVLKSVFGEIKFLARHRKALGKLETLLTDDPKAAGAKLVEIEKRAAAKAERERIKQQKIRQEKEAERLAAWVNGESVMTGFYNSPVKLRIKGDVVETSHGANVPLREAIVMHKALIAGKKIAGQRIGQYTITGMEDGSVKIGCHTIAREEIERVLTA